MFFKRRNLGFAATFVAIVVSILVAQNWLRKASERNTLINEIEQLGARVAEIRSLGSPKQSEPSWIRQWLQQAVGKRAFDGPLDITIHSVRLEAIIPKVCRLKNVESLTIMKDDLDESEIECLGQLKAVPKLTLVTFRDNAARVNSVKRLLPHVSIRDPFAEAQKRSSYKDSQARGEPSSRVGSQPKIPVP